MPTPSPKQLGYRMPAEWEPHAATWLSWPHNPDTWPGRTDPIPAVWLQIIRHLQKHEQVHINVNDQAMQNHVVTLMQQNQIEPHNVFFHQFPTNDCWVRDHGPIFVKGDRPSSMRGVAITDWEFNMWGGKYPPWELDNQIPQRIANHYGLTRFEQGIVLEGGSIDVNGEGCLLTTESCLLNPNRNPQLNREEIEHQLRNGLGVEHIFWLGEGIVGDDTDGHIDDLARFVNASTIVTVLEVNPDDENYTPLQHNWQRLKSWINPSTGKPFEIVTLSMPSPVYYEGNRLPASYANFYIANNVVLVPIFKDPQDQVATATLQTLFPTRQIIGIYCRDLIWGFGALHCITQQQPSV